MRRRPLATVAALSAVAALAVGCGDDTDDTTGAGASSSTGADSGSDTGSDSGSDSDAGSDEVAPPKFCDLITAEQIGAVVGATVTTEVGPFDACEFAQEDLRALSGMLGSTAVDIGNGGFPAYRSGTVATLTKGVDHPIEGVGKEAFVTTGTIGGGESLQAAGAAAVGGYAYTVNLSGTPETSEDDIVRVAEGLLKLMVDAAS